MGSSRARCGPADPLADELRWYFQEAEGELGAGSSFGAFVDLAMSGIHGGGRSNGAERRAAVISDRRMTGAYRELRARLQQIGERDPRLVHALYAAYGPTAWARVADAAFGNGTGAKLERALGAQYVGMALLTERLQRAHEDEVGPEPVVDDGLNRWVLAGLSRSGEALYRCAGPLVHVDEVAEYETDEALRGRCLLVCGGETGEWLTMASGAELDEAAKVIRKRRRFLGWRLAPVPPQPATPRRSLLSPGALLVTLVKAAFPAKSPRTPKQRARAAAALRAVSEIRDEAVQLLHRARLAATPREERRSPRPTTERSPRERRRVFADVRRSRPVQAYPLVPELASEALLG